MIGLGRALTVGALFLFSGSASAQLQQPRCGGWHANRFGGEGIIIGRAGAPCYGQFFRWIRPGYELIRIEIIKQPQHGTIRLVGAGDFEYLARPGQPALDLMVIRAEWGYRGQVVSSSWRFRVGTEEAYAAAGGTSDRPPPGFAVMR
jgi:hypothetical protein